MPGYPPKLLNSQPFLVHQRAYSSPGSPNHIGTGDLPKGAVKGADADARLISAADSPRLDMPGLTEGLHRDIEVSLREMPVIIHLIDPQDSPALIILEPSPDPGPGSRCDFPIGKQPSRVSGEQHDIVLSISCRELSLKERRCWGRAGLLPELPFPAAYRRTSHSLDHRGYVGSIPSLGA
jgi:hypothetical protein